MHAKLSMRLYRIVTVVISSMVLVGCLGEGSGQQRILATPPTPLTGVLIDAPVSGADYSTSGDLSGLTNDQGEFDYFSSDSVTFSIGGIVLGTAAGAPFITVVELTNSVDPTSRAATNMLVFLQSIDSDGDPSNGITISSTTRSAAAGLTLDFTAANFSTQVATIVAAIAPANAVVSESDALFNFYQAYVALGGTDTFNWLFPGFPPVGGGASYELVFADEFDGDTLSTATWNIETGYGANGWGNNEWQLYTDSPDNLRVEDGNLVISALCATPPCGVRDGTVTSARINTQDKFEFSYGKIIARIKPAVGTAAWPAFWALGANFPDIGWPRSGEIDFMEMHNAFSDNRTTHSTMHWCDESIAPPLPALCFPAENGWVFFTQNRTFPQSLGDDFHVWEADWTPDSITVSLDGVQYFERAIDPATMEEFRRDFFLILNVAMGGTLGSADQPPNGSETFPQTMLVDYVRVYQQVDGGPTGEVLVDFEGAPESYDFGMDAGFGGGASVVIPNPDQNALNPTAQVARMQKFPAEIFGGSTLSLGSNLNFSQGTVFKMKVWASRPVEVLFKLEDAITGEPADGKESFVNHSGSSMWEELCFEFDGLGGFTSNSITFIFDLGVLGDAENNPDDWTFYFDEIQQVESCEGGEPPPPPLISSFANGSFETGDLSDWTSDGNNTVGAPGVGAYAGTLAARLTTTDGAGVAQVTQTFSANPGDEINFSAWMLTESALPAGDTFGLAKIVFKDAGGNDLVPASASIGVLNTDNPGIDSVPLLNADSTPNTWVFTEAQGIAPAGTTQVVVLLLNVDFAGGENPMWFDFADASLVTDEPPPPPVENAFVDGGFESGGLSDWGVNGDATVGAPGVGARTGTSAARLNVTGDGVTDISQTFPATPGDEVNLSAWMLTETALPAAGATFGLAKIVFKDAAGMDLLPTEVSIGVINTDNPGIESTPFLNSESAVNTWIFTEAQGIAPAGTTQVQFILLDVDFGNGGNHPMWFDDAQASIDAGDGGVGEACSPCTIDFETPGFGGGFDWSVFENADNPPLEIVANPDMTGNTSATVAKFTARVDGEFFAGTQTFHPGVNNDPGVADIGPFTFDSTNSVVKVWVWKPVISEVRMQFVNTTDGAQEPLSVSNTKVNEWEQLTFDFTSFIGTTGFVDTDRLVIFPDWNQAGRTSENIIYFDNFTFGTDEPPPPPPEMNALSNGGFEDAFTDWAVGAGDNTVGAPGVGANSGTSAARLNNTGDGVAEISQTFAANPGDDVSLSVYMLTETALPAGATFGLAKIVFQDAGGNDLVPASASKGVINTDNPGIESLPFLNDASAVNTWILSEAQGIAPAGTTQVKFILLNVDFGNGAQHPMWFDDALAAIEGGEPPPPPEMNALSNGGFEDAFTDWAVGAGDNTVGAPGVGANSGTSAARLNNTGDGVAEISQTFAANPGDDVSLSVYMLTETALPAGATFGLAKIVFQDAGGNDLVPASASKGVINTDNPGIESLPFLNDASAVNTWILSEAQGIAPAGTTQVKFILLNVDFGNGAQHPMWFDDALAAIEGGEPPPPPEMNALSNGGFEDAFTDWAVGAGDNTVGAPGVGANSGTSAARLNNTADGVAEISQTFAANPGDDVSLSVYMLTETALPAGATFGLAKIVFQDAGGNDLVPASASKGVINTDNPGIESLPFLNDASAVNTWILSEAQGIAPAGTTQVKFILLNVDFGNGAQHPMWFDDALAAIEGGEPPPPPEMNALSNGGFEDAFTDWAVGAGDNTVGAPGVGANSGTSAARLNNTGDGVAEISQTFAANPGDDVSLSVYMLTETALPAGATFGLAKIVFQDAGGNDLVPASASKGVINTDNPGIESLPFLNDASAVNTWILSEAQGIAPAGTTQVKFLLLNVDFGNGAQHPMWFDDALAAIEGGEPPPPPEMNALSNGGFEDAFTDWAVGAGDNTVGAPGVGANSGTSAARLNNTGDGVAEISQTFAANPGDDVSLSVYMLTETALPAGATFGLAKIVFQDAGGNDLVPASASKGVINTDNPGIESLPFLNDASAVDTWILSEAQGIAPAGTTQVKFLLLNVDFGNGAQHPMWFDDALAAIEGGEPPPPPEMNALSNGGFEDAFTDWAVGAGDNTVGAPGVGANSGTSAARLNNTADGVAEISQTFAANPGDDVSLSVYMLTETALPAGATFGLAKIVFQDAGGNDLVPASASKGVINTDNPGIESLPFLNDASAVDTWILSEAQGIAPAGTTQVKFLLLNVDFGNGAQHPMWFDDALAAIEGGEPPPPPEMNALANGGFEDAFTDWAVGAGDNTVGAPGVGANSGTSAARLNNTGDGVAEISQTFAANPGDEVNLSVYMLTEAALPAGATFGLAKIVFKDAGGAGLVPESASIGELVAGDNPGVESRPLLNDASTPNEWVFSEAQGIAPADTTQVQLILLNVDFGNGAQHPMWFDDAQASIAAADACGGSGSELTTNGDFELGNLDCWDIFPGGGTVTADSTENNTLDGTWSAHAVAGPGNNPVLKQSFLAAGTVMPGDTINISFDMKGSAVAGGIVFPELIDEKSDMGAVGQLLDTITEPTPGWTTYNYNPMAGPDVAGGVTFQIAVVCGADAACSNDVFIDNVTVMINGGGG